MTIRDSEFPAPEIGDVFYTESERVLVVVSSAKLHLKKGASAGNACETRRLEKGKPTGNPKATEYSDLVLPAPNVMEAAQRDRTTAHQAEWLKAWTDGKLRPEVKGKARKARIEKVEITCAEWTALLPNVKAPAKPRPVLNKVEPVNGKAAPTPKAAPSTPTSAPKQPAALWAKAGADAAAGRIKEWFGHVLDADSLAVLAQSIEVASAGKLPAKLVVHKKAKTPKSEEE